MLFRSRRRRRLVEFRSGGGLDRHYRYQPWAPPVLTSDLKQLLLFGSERPVNLINRLLRVAVEILTESFFIV